MIAAPLNSADLESIARRYREAHARSDIAALAILAVEVLPHLLSDARRAAAAGARPTDGRP